MTIKTTTPYDLAQRWFIDSVGIKWAVTYPLLFWWFVDAKIAVNQWREDNNWQWN